MKMCADTMHPLLEIIDNNLHINPHTGQEKVLNSDKKIILVLAGNQSGKCLREGSKVVLKGGARKNIEDVCRDDTILSISDDFKIVESKVNHLIDSGMLPVYELETTSGRRIEVSETHPFLTKDGWKELKDINVKDFVAVPRTIPIEGTETSDKKLLKLIRYLLGDGGISQGSVMFSNINEDVLADIESSMPPSCVFKHSERCTYRIVGKHHGENEVLAFLRDIGMMGHTAHTKSIPEFVFKLTNEYIAIVINRLFACDGWIDTKGIGYCTVSKQMMYEVQHLLLRFGIVSRIRHRYTKCNGKQFPSYSMSIDRKSDMVRFQKHIGIFSKDKKLDALIKSKEIEVPNDLVPYNTDVLYSQIKRVGKSNHVQKEYVDKYNLLRGARTDNIERHKLATIANEFDDEYLKNLSSSDIFWDQVKNVEYIGDWQCFDLEIDGTHNFIANDVFVHNTSIGAIWMYNQILDWDRKVQDDSIKTTGGIVFWAVISSYPLLNEKLLPAYIELFVSILRIGEYHVQAKTISVTITRDDGHKAVYEIHFKSANNADSLASASVAAIHVDECAMPVFTYNVWTELNARLTATKGNRLFTSTIYKGNFAYSWIKRNIYDKWIDGNPNIEVIRFKSSDNPFVDPEELEEARSRMPAWEFGMRYLGEYIKPVGAIYDVFDEDKHVVEPFPIPLSTKRWGGIDPGIVNMCHIWIAEIAPYEPEYQHFPLADGTNPVFVVYRSTLTGSTTTTVSYKEQAEKILEYTDTPFITGWTGGARSEVYFRNDYILAGIEVHEPPFTEVNAGISAVYALMMNDRFYVFSDQTGLLSNPNAKEDRSILSYSRKIDDEGNILDDIDHKERYHFLDALRYCVLGMDLKPINTSTGFITMAGKSLFDV